MTISDLVLAAHGAAKERGFYDQGSRNVGELLMLIVSELSEALEAHRHDRWATQTAAKSMWQEINGEMVINPIIFESGIKDTVEDELADAIIRIADTAGYLGIDLEAHVVAKLSYNEIRPPKHGKAY